MLNGVLRLTWLAPLASVEICCHRDRIRRGIELHQRLGTRPPIAEEGEEIRDADIAVAVEVGWVPRVWPPGVQQDEQILSANVVVVVEIPRTGGIEVDQKRAVIPARELRFEDHESPVVTYIEGVLSAGDQRKEEFLLGGNILLNKK